jgi:hypothetical protein
MSEPNAEIQAEIQALETVFSALAPLDEIARRRVLGYVQERFGSSVAEKLVAPQPMSGLPEGRVIEEPVAAAVITDILTLKDQKQPKSAVEMAVLVAFYLSEVATADVSKETIGTADITKYFEQGDYPLPSLLMGFPSRKGCSAGGEPLAARRGPQASILHAPAELGRAPPRARLVRGAEPSRREERSDRGHHVDLLPERLTNESYPQFFRRSDVLPMFVSIEGLSPLTHRSERSDERSGICDGRRG